MEIEVCSFSVMTFTMLTLDFHYLRGQSCCLAHQQSAILLEILSNLNFSFFAEFLFCFAEFGK